MGQGQRHGLHLSAETGSGHPKVPSLSRRERPPGVRQCPSNQGQEGSTFARKEGVPRGGHTVFRKPTAARGKPSIARAACRRRPDRGVSSPPEHRTCRTRPRPSRQVGDEKGLTGVNEGCLELSKGYPFRKVGTGRGFVGGHGSGRGRTEAAGPPAPAVQLPAPRSGCLSAVPPPEKGLGWRFSPKMPPLSVAVEQHSGFLCLLSAVCAQGEEKAFPHYGGAPFPFRRNKGQSGREAGGHWGDGKPTARRASPRTGNSNKKPIKNRDAPNTRMLSFHSYKPSVLGAAMERASGRGFIVHPWGNKKRRGCSPRLCI
jgi:hypothetical protein